MWESDAVKDLIQEALASKGNVKVTETPDIGVFMCSFTKPNETYIYQFFGLLSGAALILCEDVDCGLAESGWSNKIELASPDAVKQILNAAEQYIKVRHGWTAP